MKGKFYSVFVMLMLASVSLFAQPKIASFSPASGDTGTTVTINGSNFNTSPASNLVRFGVTQATVLSATASKLTVTVPAGANYGAVSVTNVATGLRGVSSAYFIPTFSPKKGRIHDTDFYIGSGMAMTNAQVFASTVSDLNNDGKPDLLAVGGYSNASTYRLYFGQNTSTLGVASFDKDSFSLTTTATPLNMASGDIDGDGKPDVVITLLGFSNVTILRNISTTPGGSIWFAAKTTATTNGAPYGVALIDVDGDGKKDIVTTSKSGGYISVLPNNSSVGTIAFGTAKTFTTGKSPEQIATADFDGDGKWDIVTTNRTATSISVLSNISTGIGNFNFATKIDYTTAKGVKGVGIADIDSDGKLDIVSSSDSVNLISIFRNLSSIGNISFASKFDYSVGSSMNYTGFGDFDGDGKIDIAVNAYKSIGTFLYYGTAIVRNTSTPGIFSFTKSAVYGLSLISNGLAFVGDLTLDGKPDFTNYGRGFVINGINKSALAGNAILDSLSITGGTLSPSAPDFKKVNNFFVNIPYDSASIHVYADVVDTGYATLSVQVNGKGFTAITAKTYSPVSLDPGPNTIQVKVTAQNGTERVYTITAVRVLRPQLLSFTPPSGPIGTLIYLNGKDFSVNPSVSIGGVNAVIVNYTDTTMTVMAMPNTTTNQVTITTISGSSTHSDVFAVTSTTYPSILEGSKKNINSGANTRLGTSVAISADGNTAVYGANAVGGGVGATAISTRSGGVWSSLDFLPASGYIGNSYQGSAVAISADGKTIISGGFGDNGGVGAAWIFTNTNGVWKQQAKLKGTGYGTFTTPKMGCSVALSADGNTAAFGGSGDNSNSGSVWIFVRTDSVWKQQQLIASTSAAADFGSAVSLSADGNTLLIGSEGENTNVGAAFVYIRNGSNWVSQRKLVGTGSIFNSHQGKAVALSADGNTALVGGYFDSTARGACWLYKRTGTTWRQVGKKIVNDSSGSKEQFGYTLSLSADGNTAVIGSLHNSFLIGKPYVYKFENGSMVRKVNGLASTGLIGGANTYFGSAVAISADGNAAVVGAAGDNSSIGAVWNYVSVQSTVSSLSNLTTSIGSLSPSFNATTFNYTLNVGSDNIINLTPTTTDTTATILVNINAVTPAQVKSGATSPMLSLNFGANIIKVTVVSQTGTTTVYTITVNRDCPKDTTVTVKNICSAALPFIWNGSSYTNSGTYYKNFTNAFGCDSVAVLNLTVASITPINDTVNLSGCTSVVYKGITYTNSTILSDTLKSYLGCDSVYRITNIAVNPKPVVGSIVGDTIICVGSSTLYSNTTVGGTWGASNSTILTMNTTGLAATGGSTGYVTVSYSVTNAFGCTGTSQLNVLVSPKVTPSVQISANASAICKGTNVTFTATGINTGTTANYVWKKNGAVVGGNATTYTDATLSGADTLTCTLTANPACSTTSTAISNPLVIKVNADILGSIKHPTLGTIANVTATITNGASTSSTITAGSNYRFNCLSADSSYTIRPSKINDVSKSNGISTIDLLYLQSHILNKVVLNSPYKIIAADVNNSGDVSTIDLLYLKRFILTIDTLFPGKRLWAFVDSSYVFPNPAKPFPYKDSIRIVNPTANAVAQSFVGIKLGDFNFDWNPAVLGVRKATQPVELEYQPIAGTATSSQVRIPIKVNRFDQLLGLQFTLHFDASEYSFAGIDNNLLQLDYGTTHSSEGVITFLWMDKQLQPTTLADGTTILELVLNKRNGGTATPPVLQISSSHTPIEAWDSQYAQHNILLKAASATTEAETTLDSYTLSPNPASANVFLSLQVSTSKTLRVTVSNAAGQKVRELTINAPKGQSVHPLPLRSSKGLAAGMYYVDVQGMDSRSVKKLVIR